MLDHKFVEEARAQFWQEYNERVAALGCTLTKDGLMHGPDGISIVASVQGASYNKKMIARLRTVIPQTYTYRGQSIPVMLFPSFSALEKIVKKGQE